MNLKVFVSCLFFLLSNSLLAKDLTSAFTEKYNEKKTFDASELEQLKEYEINLIPGILSESFIRGDKRSKLELSLFTKEYFGVQLKLFKKHNLLVTRLSSSSQSTNEIRANIRDAFTRADKKMIFITHSLGGLALLEELISNPENQKQVAGIIFLQSPFYGSPIADVFFDYPFQFDKWLVPILPFVNTSEETIKYLGVQNRVQFMDDNKLEINELVSNLPVLTVGGVARSSRSLFGPAISVMEAGCIKVFSKCVTKKLYQGPFDQSDGMVPFENSKLEGADFVKLENADHGETVVSIPWGSYHKEYMTTSLVGLLLSKIKAK